jgi:transposase-like protein
MSRQMADTPKRRARRQFTDEFKAGAIRLMLAEARSSAPSRAISI